MRISIALACLAVFASPARATPATAAKAYKAQQTAALKQFRADNDGRLAFAFAGIAVVELQLKGMQITPANAVEDVVDALGPRLAEISANALLTMVDVAVDADALLLAEGVKTLPGFLPGDGGAGDQFEQKIDKELARVRAKVLKRLGQFRKALAKATNDVFGLTFVVPAMHAQGAPNPNNPSTVGPFDAVTYAPRILIALATSSNLVVSDGRMVIGARGFVSFINDSTNFYVFGPEVRTSLNVNVPDTSSSGYSQTKLDSLNEGGYIVFFDQDPNNDTIALESSFDRMTMGVP